MFRRILFPTKFEEFSLQILKSICCLKAAGLEDVILLHVIDVDKLYTQKWGIVFNLTAIQEKAEERLTHFAQYLETQGIRAGIKITAGPLVSEILRTGEEENVSLIIAGRQKRSRLGDLFIGSVTDRIIRSSTKPVLVSKYYGPERITGEGVEPFCDNLFRKILYAVDWSPWAERAKEYLFLLQMLGVSDVAIVHVVEDHVMIEDPVQNRTEAIRELIKARREMLEALNGELQERGFQTRGHLIEAGKSYHEINRIASEEDVSLIIMGSQGKGFVEGILWGSVSQRVVEYSEKPVLVVK
jgi:nucleotide-binding universal stress UspA family protein